MKLLRVIEEFSNETLHKEYMLNITPETILEVLEDLVLMGEDYEDEIYGQYNLTEAQVQKLKQYLIEPLNENFEKYTYELGCYEE